MMAQIHLSPLHNPKTDSRAAALHQWLTAVLSERSFSVAPLAGDASFRRYVRVTTPKYSYIVMDAPPQQEDCTSFIAIATAFANTPVRLPTIFSMDLAQGFLLLSDFGDRQLLLSLTKETVNALYCDTMQTLVQMQSCYSVNSNRIPHFDDALYWKEFDIFLTWYVQKNLNRMLSVEDKKKLKDSYQRLIDSAHAQPKVFVHRDYHSRNIMLCPEGAMGILDFQDAVWGPITYDLVSLLRDCYIAWPLEQTEAWVRHYFQRCVLKSNNNTVDFNTFLRWFDWMGLQRHLKCLGIFSRLCYRDHKNTYLKDIPRVLGYAMHVCEKYPELRELGRFLGLT